MVAFRFGETLILIILQILSASVIIKISFCEVEVMADSPLLVKSKAFAFGMTKNKKVVASLKKFGYGCCLCLTKNIDQVHLCQK